MIDKFEFECYENKYSVIYDSEQPDYLLFSRDDSEYKRIKVADCSFGCIYIVQKTQIKAYGGALGLFDFIKKDVADGLCMCDAMRVSSHAMDYVKESKIKISKQKL